MLRYDLTRSDPVGAEVMLHIVGGKKILTIPIEGAQVTDLICAEVLLRLTQVTQNAMANIRLETRGPRGVGVET